MARRRRPPRKKPRRRRPRSRPDNHDIEDEDHDYIAEEEDAEDSETPSESDISPRGSSDEESFQFSGSASSSEEDAPKRHVSAATQRKRKRRDEVVAVSARSRRNSRNLDFVVDEDDDSDEDFTPDDDDLEIVQVAAKKKKTTRRKPTAAAPAKKRRSRAAASDDDDDDDDDDFIVRGRNTAVKRRKKAPAKRTKKRSLVDDSELSDSDFVVSDDDFDTINRKRKRRRTVTKTRKRRRGDSDSDFDGLVPEEDFGDLGVGGILEKREPKKILVKAKGEEEKGKEKEGDGLEKQLCGICLSEEQKGTIQGVLNCCAHYFCFACIMEWSKVESRCPVCKRRFVTISKSGGSEPGSGMRKAVVRVQKRDQVYQPSEEEIQGLLDPYENVVCMICQQGGDDNLMLLCDICDSSAHTYCVGLGREVPEGNWYCEGCRFTGGGGPSNSRAQDTTLEHRRSSSDLLSGGQSSTNGIDLNALPRPPPDESHGVASQASIPRETHQRLRVRLSNNRPRRSGDLLSGSSTLQVQDASVDHGTSNSHLSSVSMKIEDSSANTLPSHSSSQRIDLNLSPGHLLGEDHGASTQAPGAGASTLSGRRAIHQRIRILLSSSRPRQVFASEVEQGTGALHVHERQNPLHRVSATERPQQNGRPILESSTRLVPRVFGEGIDFQHVDEPKEQVQSLVKRHLRNLRGSTLDHETFKEIARRSTHTILAACGVDHRRSMVVGPIRPPDSCPHNLDEGHAYLMKGCCSSCFNSFVKGVVQKVIDSS